MPLSWVALALLLGTLWSPGAAAQGFDASLVKPALAGRTLLVTTSSETLAPYSMRGELLTDLGINTLRGTFGDRVGVVVGRDVLAHAMVRAGLPYGAEVALSFPSRLHALGKNPEQAGDNQLDPALGDLRLSGRYRPYEAAWGGTFVAPFVVLPTGNQEELMGGGGFSGGMSLGVDGGSPIGGLHWAVNTGWWERSTEPGAGTPRGRQFRSSAGADYGLIRRYDLAVRAGLEVLSVLATAPGEGALDTPLEVIASAVADMGRCALRMGIGTGIVGGIGASSARLLLGLGCGAQPTNDRDGDSLADLVDGCPDKAEDRDGFQDGDGCPDIDNDGDGVLDHLDECPNDPQAEGRTDGCPEPDKDGDGIEGKADKCPDEPEDKDGFEDDDGCPDDDDDKDGVADADDQCKEQAEDRDGWEDDDGCPDPDNDSDGFADKDDKCPDQPETWNSSQDRDGCPDGKSLLKVSPSGVEFTPPIPFKKNKPKFSKKKAAPGLEALASLLRVRSDVTAVTITVTMDIKGKEAKSVKVAAKRAAAVAKALRALGIPASRLKTAGEFGDEALTIKLER